MVKAGVFVIGTGVSGVAVEQFIQASSTSLQSVEFVCPVDAVGKEFDLGLAASPSGTPLTTEALGACARCLVPGATIYVYDQDTSRSEALLKDLLLSGFVEGKAVPAASGLLVAAQRPKWEVGAKAALPLKRTAAQPAAAPAAAAWKVGGDDEDELVDEDTLLTEEDKARPAGAPAAESAGDCSTSRKACKNCSCGRAEKEAAGEKVTLTQEMLDNPQTNCGNCALGDAFRCAGCPYRGLPAFEPGKKITLAADFLTADA